MTPASAEAALRRYWPVHAKALRDRDLRQLAALTTGSAQRWEVGAAGCGCLSSTTLRPLVDASFFVPRQTAYPAYFVVDAETVYADGMPGSEILVFTRRSARSPWLVAMNSTYQPGTGEEITPAVPDTDREGFTKPVNAARVGRARTQVLRFMALWRKTKETGRVPDESKRFHVVGAASTRLSDMALHRQDTVQKNGLFGHYSFALSPGLPLTVVPMAAGLR